MNELLYGDRRLPERFWAKVEPDPDTGCWMWTGACCAKGYAQCKVHGKTLAAHKVAFQTLVGEPVSGRLVGRCRARLCIHPAHRRPTQNTKICKPRNPFDAPPDKGIPWRRAESPLAERQRANRAAAHSRTFIACMVLAAVQASEARVEADRRRLVAV